MTDTATEDSPGGQPLGLPLNDGLGWDINRALFAGECQRLAEWALIGPVQRAALESFAERLLAAERERIKARLLSMDDGAAGRHNYYSHAAWVLFDRKA